MNVSYVSAFEDNYIWFIESNGGVIVIDPGQAEPVMAYLSKYPYLLKAILLTHGHEDHIGGVQTLKEHYRSVKVYGPEEVAHLTTERVKDGDRVEIDAIQFSVIKTAGHTQAHVSFYTPGHLFCGDALFMAGCGRVFTKDYQAQYDTLLKLRDLPDDTKVYGGHEYSLTNLTFAQTIDPNNPDILKVKQHVQETLARGEATLPSTIGQEKKINVLMMADDLGHFIELREKRDQF